MSARNDGAAKLTVNAATPPRMKSRRVTAIWSNSGFRAPGYGPAAAWSRKPITYSHELVFRRADNQTRQARRLHDELRVGSVPRAAGVQVVDQRMARLALEGHRRQPIEKQAEHVLRRRASRRCLAPEIEALVERQRGGEIHPRQHGPGREPALARLPPVHIGRLEQRLAHRAQRRTRRIDRQAVPADFLDRADDELDRP